MSKIETKETKLKTNTTANILRAKVNHLSIKVVHLQRYLFILTISWGGNRINAYSVIEMAVRCDAVPLILLDFGANSINSLLPFTVKMSFISFLLPNKMVK